SHLQTLAQAQARLGADVRVLCVNHRNAAGHDVTWKAFASTPTVEEADGDVRLLRVGRRASLFRLDVCPGLLGLGRRLRGWAPDVVHLHVPNPTMVLALLPWVGKCRVVITHHSDVVRQKKLGLVMRPLEGYIYTRARRVAVTSPPYAESSPALRRYADK